MLPLHKRDSHSGSLPVGVRTSVHQQDESTVLIPRCTLRCTCSAGCSVGSGACAVVQREVQRRIRHLHCRVQRGVQRAAACGAVAASLRTFHTRIAALATCMAHSRRLCGLANQIESNESIQSCVDMLTFCDEGEQSMRPLSPRNFPAADF